MKCKQRKTAHPLGGPLRAVLMIVDLYAGGPSGWSTALSQLDFECVGLEMDEWACATRAAVGHRTLRCDLSSYPTGPFAGKVTGLTASPPCQTFSDAGDRAGRGHIARLIQQVEDADWATSGLDERTAHVLHVGRWVDDLRPDWVCFEQVQQVEPVWAAFARLLSDWGYSTWSGVLCAADYGTPQERSRAVLIASRRNEVWAPAASHKSWVSMADAFRQVEPGWAWTELHTQRDQRADGSRQTRPTSRPAPTLDTQGNKMKWGMNGSPKMQIQVQEALVLQDFPPLLPVAGVKREQFRQVGNAVPVRLARAVVEVAAGMAARPAEILQQPAFF